MTRLAHLRLKSLLSTLTVSGKLKKEDKNPNATEDSILQRVKSIF